MKAVLISIRPKWCELIARGKKILEIRKNKPNLEMPFKCYIYCTKYQFKSIFLSKFLSHNGYVCHGKIIGEFVCDGIIYLGNVATDHWKDLHGTIHELQKRLVTERACLTEAEMLSYGGHYGWHISDLVIYDRPKELSEFRKPCGSDSHCEACRMFSEFEGQCCDKALTLKRPPQSWCYVEELK